MVPEAISKTLEPMQRVQRLVACYEEPRDPDKLDCLVYHVDRLHRILLELNTCNSEQVRSSGSKARIDSRDRTRKKRFLDLPSPRAHTESDRALEKAKGYM